MASQVGREWRCSMRKFRRVMQQGNKPAETVAPEAGALLPKGRGTEEEARTCLACGRELVGKRPQAKFCGEDCRKKHHRQKKREDETVPDAEDDPRISLSKLLSQTPPAALSGRRLAAWRKLVELGDDNLPIHHQTEEGRRYRAAELAKRPNAELAAIARDITWGMCCKKPYRLATFPGLAVLDGNLLAVILDLGGGESVPLPVWPINNGAILDDHARLGALVTVVGDILRRFEAFAISDAPLLHSTLKSWTEGSLVIDAKLMARRLERPVKGNRRPHRTTAENVEKRDRLKRENVTDAVVQLLIGAHAFFYIGWQEPIARSTEEESGDADGDGDGGRVDTSDVDPTSDDDVADVEDAGVREYEEGDDNAACYDAAATNYDRDGERDEDAHDYEPNDE